MTPVRPGLCSVTFRALAPEAVIERAAAAGVAAIEWGADVHLPPGAPAAQIAGRAAAAGIASPSLGSYVRAGDRDAARDFATALDTAWTLGAGNVRVWAGRVAGTVAGPEMWARVTADLAAMADRAAAAGLTLTLEFHRGTLTETAADAARLLAAVGHPALFTYWQPVPGRGLACWLEELALLRPWLGDLHVFHWRPGHPQDIRRPLAEAAADWARLFDAWQPAPHWPHGRTAYLEFVAGDTAASFAADMEVLRRLVMAGTPA